MSPRTRSARRTDTRPVGPTFGCDTPGVSHPNVGPTGRGGVSGPGSAELRCLVRAQLRLERQGLAAASAVLDAHQAEAEAREARPQPPEVTGIAQGADEGQQREESHEPDGRTDRDRTYAVDVERVDFGDGVAPLSEFDLADLGAAELMALRDPLTAGALAGAQLLLGLMVGVVHVHQATADP